MTYEIVWTSFAEEQMDAIQKFIDCNSATLYNSEEILVKIIDTVKVLKENPEIGQKEINIPHKNSAIEFRYLIQKHYKIIYFVDKPKKTVIIADIFDTRQSPDKLLRNK